MRQKINKYIDQWEKNCYFDGIPDEAPYELEKRNLVPSYKKIAMCILNNDNTLKGLGFSGKHSIYYDFYKKIELESKSKVKQLKLEL